MLKKKGTPRSRAGSYVLNTAPPVAPVNLVNAQADILEDGIIPSFEPTHISIQNNHLIPSNSSTKGGSSLSLLSDNSNSIFISNTSSTLPCEIPSRQSSSSSTSSQAPPNFSDLVKRSTRFITSVPAFDVLEKLMKVLDSCRFNKINTIIGQIGFKENKSLYSYIQSKMQFLMVYYVITYRSGRVVR